ncbi:LOW QUALITY PROTEIN: fibroblast growth factor binding protein 2a [Pholidichthys leucotaenia]
MWTQVTALLLACCLPAEAQTDRRQSLWDDPIKFNTKAKDLCKMSQGELTKLRVSCQGNRHFYWCEYVGTPHTCRTHNKNPRHYFVQMRWNLRKLKNACQVPRQIKPHMCRKAAAGPRSKSGQWVKTTQRVSPQPTTPPAESNAKSMARQYRWRSLQGICSFLIGLFQLIRKVLTF